VFQNTKNEKKGRGFSVFALLENLTHYDFFMITTYAVQCSAVQPKLAQCSAV
jgi:hypothetical protein